MFKNKNSFNYFKKDDLSVLYKSIEYYTNLLQMMKKDEIQIYKQKAIEDNYHSNAIEGSRVTYKETEAILKGLGDTISRYHTEKAEILDYANAQKFMMEHYSMKTPVSELFVSDLHYELLRNARPDFAGHYRVYGEDVLAGRRDVGYTKGEYVDQMLEQLFNWYSSYNQSSMSIRELFEFTIEFKYRFLRIHPFNDGNGRISRLLMNYIFLLNHMFPLVVLVDDRQDYMEAVINAQREDDLTYYYRALAKIYIRELKNYVRNREPVL